MNRFGIDPTATRRIQGSRALLSPRQIDHNDVGVVPQPVEYDVLAVGGTQL